ncbi:MAG: hypothetical protein NTX05_01925 [Fusobacteria bacterium]|nr:hypothetical protein [Fusobacteriota bacterium]
MKKIILSVAAVTLVATAFASSPWTVTQYNQNGVAGNITAGVSGLAQYQAGPVWGLGANADTSYGFGNGAVVYGNIAASRTWDMLPYISSEVSAFNHIGISQNSFAPTVGVQYSLDANTLVGVQVGYGNYTFAPGSAVGAGVSDASKSVGYSFNPYAQYTFGQSTVLGSFNYSTLWNADINQSIPGNGVANKGTVAYSYALTPDLAVGVTGAMQEVNQNYLAASIIRYANSNTYQAYIGSLDYAQIMPGITYNVSQLPGLSLGLQTGLTWFNTRKCEIQNTGYNFMSTFVFIPSVNYTLPITDSLNLLASAEYNGVKVINGSYVHDSGAIQDLNGSTLNSSFQVGTGLSYNF